MQIAFKMMANRNHWMLRQDIVGVSILMGSPKTKKFDPPFFMFNVSNTNQIVNPMNTWVSLFFTDAIPAFNTEKISVE